MYCSSGILFSFLSRIFAGVHWRGLKRQLGDRNMAIFSDSIDRYIFGTFRDKAKSTKVADLKVELRHKSGSKSARSAHLYHRIRLNQTSNSATTPD